MPPLFSYGATTGFARCRRCRHFAMRVYDVAAFYATRRRVLRYYAAP